MIKLNHYITKFAIAFLVVMTLCFVVFLIKHYEHKPTGKELKASKYDEVYGQLLEQNPLRSQFCLRGATFEIIGESGMAIQYHNDFSECIKQVVNKYYRIKSRERNIIRSKANSNLI